MRRSIAAVALGALLLVPPVAAVDGPSATVADVFEELGEARGHLRADRTDAADRAVDNATGAFETIAPADGEAARRLRALSNVTDPEAFRTGVVGFEAALMAHAADEAWRGLLWDRVDLPGRPTPPNGSARTDAAMALRVQEAVSSVELAKQADRDPTPHIERVIHLWNATRDRAGQRLPDDLHAELDGTLTDLRDRASNITPDRPRLTTAHLLLAAWAYGRSVESLDGTTAALEGDLAHLVRQARWGDRDLPALRNASLSAYQRSRTAIFRTGQGVEATDRAWQSIQGGSFPVPASELARGVGVQAAIEALHEASGLGYGVEIKIASTTVPVDEPRTVSVALFRTPLAGVASVEITLGYDASVVAVDDVRPGAWSDGFAWDGSSGRVTVEGSTAPAYVGRATVASLNLSATGDDRDRTDVTLVASRIGTPNGTDAVATIRTGSIVLQGTPDEPGPPLPGPGLSAAAALLLGAAAVRAVRSRGPVPSRRSA